MKETAERKPSGCLSTFPCRAQPQHQVIADTQAINLDDQRVELGQVGRHPHCKSLGRQRHNWREAADFEDAIARHDRQVALRKSDSPASACASTQ